MLAPTVEHRKGGRVTRCSCFRGHVPTNGTAPRTQRLQRHGSVMTDLMKTVTMEHGLRVRRRSGPKVRKRSTLKARKRRGGTKARRSARTVKGVTRRWIHRTRLTLTSQRSQNNNAIATFEEEGQWFGKESLVIASRRSKRRRRRRRRSRTSKRPPAKATVGDGRRRSPMLHSAMRCARSGELQSRRTSRSSREVAAEWPQSQ
mmetsp:Transcript_26798/g.70426  ORF Transcript_26798/g.70426 Transcript_26798/m.70426 type:complete len:203 (-) Transcript_26798:1752-2360(-)